MEQPGPEHVLFKQWVLEQDVTINGVGPAKFPGRGMGMIAEKNIEAGETLVVVPRDALLSTDSIVDQVKDAALDQGISVNGLIAMYLAVTARQEGDDPYAEWRRVWPSRADMATMPVQWPYALRGLRKVEPDQQDILTGGRTWSPLPPSVNGEWSAGAVADLRHGGLATSSSRLERQRRRLDKDWTRAKGLCEGQIEYNDYVYHWLLVNSRSFFWDETDDRARFESREDKLAMCPFMDYFNHTDAGGCAVAYNEHGYSVTADRAYRAGEELLVSYGAHDNDLLLVDYGFLLDRNSADSVPLDDVALFGPAGVYKWRELLNAHDYFGEYRVSGSGSCYRTRMAAAVRVLPAEADWIELAAGRRELTPAEERRVDAVIRDEWLAAWLREAERALAAWAAPSMQAAKDIPQDARRLAVARWTQIRDIVRSAAQAMQA